MVRRFSSAALVALSALALTACSTTDEPAAVAPTGPNVVTVADMAYSPAALTIEAGETVTWFFDDTVQHDVVGLDDASSLLNSSLMTTGEYSQTFDEPGTYEYVCTIHPNMTGTVTVL